MTQLSFDDYTLPLEAVVKAEREARTPETILDAFTEWVERNPNAMRAMYRKAIDLAYRGKRVSAKYLVEWLRYDADVSLSPNKEADWKVPNEFTPLVARYLVRRNQGLEAHFEMKPSAFDKLELPKIGEW